MSVFLIIALSIFSLSGIFGITRQLQMLQQNSYFPSRYTGWLKDNIPLAPVFYYFIASLLLFADKYGILMFYSFFILGITVYNTVTLQRKSIKKLVFTARVKRLYAAAAVILILLVLLYGLTPKSPAGKLAVVFCTAASIVTPVLTYLVWLVTLPIEKIFSLYYVTDAKKILKSLPELKIVGITGSYGKTTSKFILTRILSEKYNVVCTPQSYNTPMGVVRTIRESLKPQTQIFVCEMGAKKVGDIKEICKIVNPHIGMITSVGAQHLESFKTIDRVFKTKFELADAVKKKNGKVFVNGDSKEIIERISKDSYEIYGSNNGFLYKACDITYGKNGSEFTFKSNNAEIKLSSRLLGLHSIINICGAVAIALELGLSAEDIQFAVASLKATEHRLELKSSVNGSLLIDDAYNANPEGSIEAVNVLGSFDGMKKVIITPGLIELGSREYDCNFALGVEAAKKCDIIILVGKNRSKPLAEGVASTKFNKENLHIVSSFAEAMEFYSLVADSNTVVLLENDLPDNYLN